MIYCIEDDNGIRNLMLYTLNASGFEAVGFPDSAEFWRALEGEKPELILLDIMLPGEDGISVLKKLRADAALCGIPVIMASAKGTEYDKVLGLDLGADDNLAKPFGMMDMVSRVKSVLRRTSPKAAAVLRCGSIELNDDKHSVTSGGRAVVLTLKEYDMLRLFLRNPGLVLTRDQLLERVWGQDFAGETRTVDVHVGTLRTKLGEAGNQIETVRGVGYRMESGK
ncbi:MAG: response regulator transcription factor [Clostridiales bacterium]|nr:response regulator transcription factor [Candidatus Apopatocola equi]